MLSVEISNPVVAIEPRISGVVHLAHATRTERRHDFVRTQAALRR
jgi:hypothetical protein